MDSKGGLNDLENASSAKRSGLAPGKKEGLLSLVNYQSGSVVSRAIVNQASGTVTLFAFDEGESLSEHTSPYDALLCVLEGCALVTIEGIQSEMREGEAIILPAGKPHALRATERFKMLLTMIRQ